MAYKFPRQVNVSPISALTTVNVDLGIEHMYELNNMIDIMHKNDLCFME